MNPPPGEEYRLDWFKRFNVWQGPFFSKAEMDKYGLKQQIWCQRGMNEKQIRDVVNDAKAKGFSLVYFNLDLDGRRYEPCP